MENISFNEDIAVLCVTAASFPEGIMDAQRKLHSAVPFSLDRKYFGISRPENGGPIVYRAGAQELESGEAEKLNLDRLVLKKGNYIGLTLHDYMKDLPAIGLAFKQILAQPGLDPQGYCVEWYVSQTEVKCIVRLANK